MENPFLKYVEGIQSGLSSAREIAVAKETQPPADGPKVLLFSPHPDDECITGLLPLRLMREMGKRIINIPVTYGSNVERQSGRAAELADACSYLGWEVFRGKDGFDSLEVNDVVNILKELQPEMILIPHIEDWNSRHISTHVLVRDALKLMGPDFSCTVIESEFWAAMNDPNLMVEGDAQIVADLVAATSLHTEEVARNPYHLLLPAWMQDNVRRGGELIAGQGEAVPDYSFATLYRISKWANGEMNSTLDSGKQLPMGAANIKELF